MLRFVERNGKKVLQEGKAMISGDELKVFWKDVPFCNERTGQEVHERATEARDSE